ncbi:hypothetical protein AAE02nite_15800 [Adhaeribacter aerolatus]|uniref:HTTM-like domain-containing protein n=1 Tax=Adhaeribacter aerolatus TaxID=670289 RepID=A0A512AW16_9BACT|nr:HTTM domain-containing protein [Adhaeribacter aerolatus]GEO03916.1 hypothetical protein AAE02nite_15800 [Adhaeribacter aerolatus]
MLRKYFGKIEAIYAIRVNALGLAFFRIFYCLVLLLEVKQLFTFRTLIFSEVTISINLITSLLLLWGLALIFLFLGWFTRLAAVINYSIGVFIVWHMPDYKYHLDFVMTTVNFLLLFLPVSAGLSLDKYFGRQQHSEKYSSDQVSSLYGWLLVLLGIGLVYLDSSVYKFSSPMWRSGLGFWLPSSLPQNAHTNLSWVLNQELLVRFIGYGILLFEVLFLFLIWFRPLRWVLVLGGMLLHLGIGIAYPIPHFSLIMVALYIPLLPDSFWYKLRLVWGRRVEQNQNELYRYAAFKPESGPRLKRYLMALFILYAGVGQLMCILAAPAMQDFAEKYCAKDVLAGTQYLFKPFYYVNQKFLGIVSHDIFLDKHFAGYNQILNLSYVAKDNTLVPLPLFTQTGQPGTYSTGRIWTKWAYRVTGAHPEPNSLQTGMAQFSAFWMQQQGLNLKEATFLIRVKKIAVVNNWEKNYLNRQMQQPWRTIGRVYWYQGKCRFEWLSDSGLLKEK